MTTTAPAPTYAMGSAWPADAPDCAACNHPAAEHCRKCGCGRGVGTRDECICAKYVPHLDKCEDCGTIFRTRAELQIHRSPTPRCVSGAFAIGGKFADRPYLGAPLAGVTSGNAMDKRTRREQRRNARRGK